MTSDRFADQLDAATYEDDDETLGVFESTPADQDCLWLSGRLFRCLAGVAAAYEGQASDAMSARISTIAVGARPDSAVTCRRC